MNNPKGAKSFDGVKGNLMFIFWHKLWATLIVLAAGFVLGSFWGGLVF